MFEKIVSMISENLVQKHIDVSFSVILFFVEANQLFEFEFHGHELLLLLDIGTFSFKKRRHWRLLTVAFIEVITDAVYLPQWFDLYQATRILKSSYLHPASFRKNCVVDFWKFSTETYEVSSSVILFFVKANQFHGHELLLFLDIATLRN